MDVEFCLNPGLGQLPGKHRPSEQEKSFPTRLYTLPTKDIRHEVNSMSCSPHRCWQNREFLCYLGTRKFCTPIHTWCTSFALQTINQVFVFYDPVSKTGHFSEVRVFSVSPEQPPLCRVWVSGVLKHPPAAAEALVQRSPPHAARRHPAAQEHCSVAGRLHPRAPPWHPPVFCFRASSVGSS